MKKPVAPIPTSAPLLDGNERAYIEDCLKRNWISFNGPYTKRLENAFAKYLGVQHAVFCSSGTAAIHLALLSLGIGAGDEVIIPDFTIIVSASMPILTGAKPVLVDCDETLCIDPDLIEASITPRTRAIMPVHIYGNPSHMQKVISIARKHNLFVIEDASAALGKTIRGKYVGTFGDAGCFSFYTSKTVLSGEGGMLVTNRARVASLAKLLRNQAFESPRFIHQYLGFNYRATDLEAAIALAQLEGIKKKIRRRKKISRLYANLLGKQRGISVPVINPGVESEWYWMFPVLIGDSFGRSRDEVIAHMAQNGIQCERFFTPISKQPVFGHKRQKQYPDIGGAFPNAWLYAAQGLYLPSGLTITDAEQRYIVSTLVRFRR